MDQETYLDLVARQHKGRPKFEATLRALLEPLVAQQATLNSLPLRFDLDAAAGAQLDAVGAWIGRSRLLDAPITGVYFSFDDPAVGFDRGTWRGMFDPLTGIERLPDETYRIVLRARVASNMWDGTTPGMRRAYDYILPPAEGYVLLIEDRQDMSMLVVLLGRPLDALTRALLLEGALEVKPMGVQVAHRFGTAPVFGFDASTATVQGFNQGSWVTTS